LFGELFVAAREICKHLAIGFCGRGKVCEGIGGIIDKPVHGVVGPVVTSFMGGSLGKTEIKVCFGEVSLEVCPGFVCCWSPAPFTARLRKKASAEHDGVGVGDNLGGSIGVAAGIGVVHGVF
jgi:hypothetical protein